MRLLRGSRRRGICAAVVAWTFAGSAGFVEAAPPEDAALVESVSALEQSAVNLHRAYTVWLRKTGKFESRVDDGLYGDLCAFRNSCRTLAWQIRSRDVRQVYGGQMTELVQTLGVLSRYQDYDLDPALKELMRQAWTLACSFRSDCEVVLAPASAGPLEALAQPQRSPPRVGPLRLMPNRYDIMSYLENH